MFADLSLTFLIPTLCSIKIENERIRFLNNFDLNTKTDYRNSNWSILYNKSRIKGKKLKDGWVNQYLLKVLKIKV